MEKKYRLLDVGESWGDVTGDEMLTVSNGWRSASGYGTVQAHTMPMRRLDDGKGTYILIGRPNVVEMGDYTDTSFWKWGAGWLLAGKQSIFADAVIWRKAREVDKPSPKEAPSGLWVVVPREWKRFTSWEEACKSAKADARKSGDGAEFCVCHIDRTFRCVVEVVEKEVSK